MKYGAPFENTLSTRAQWELIAVLVWISWALAGLRCVMLWRSTDAYQAIGLTMIHLLPWITAVIERRRIVSESGVTIAPELLSRSLMRLLWSAYAVIWAVELTSSWH